MLMRPPLPECEDVGVSPGFEEGDLKRAVGDRVALPDQLMQARLGDGALAVLVDVEPTGCSGPFAVEEHAKAHRLTVRCRPHHQVKIACVEAMRDPPTRSVEHGCL